MYALFVHFEFQAEWRYKCQAKKAACVLRRVSALRQAGKLGAGVAKDFLSITNEKGLDVEAVAWLLRPDEDVNKIATAIRDEVLSARAKLVRA